MTTGVVLFVIVASALSLGTRGGREIAGSGFGRSLRLVPSGPNQQPSPGTPPPFRDLQTRASSHGFKMEGGFDRNLRQVPTGPNNQPSPDGPPTFADFQTRTSGHGFKMEGGFGRNLRLVPSGPNQEQPPDGPPTLM